MRVLHVVGARSSVAQVSAVHLALTNSRVDQTLVTAGERDAVAMSRGFFEEFGIPVPDVDLGIGSRTHAAQTFEIMTRFEPVVLEFRPDLVLVYGDGNTTAGAARVCSKLLVPFGHVEAGLRCFDRAKPEEIDRIATDHLADYLFTASRDADVNLLREGIDSRKIHRVGNVTIDTLVRLLPAAATVPLDDVFDTPYALVTLHRPSNVDDPDRLAHLLATLNALSRDIRIIFPVHPRTCERLRTVAGWTPAPKLTLIDPLGYVEFLALQLRARFVITDSNGVQEETTYLGVPCITMRASTERPITTTVGTNVLTGLDPRRMLLEARRVLDGGGRRGTRPRLWDGSAASRIADVIAAAQVERQSLTA